MKQYSLLIKFLLLLVGIVYGQEKSDVQSTGGCNGKLLIVYFLLGLSLHILSHDPEKQHYSVN